MDLRNDLVNFNYIILKPDIRLLSIHFPHFTTTGRQERGQKTELAGPAIIYCVQGASYRGEQGHICHYHSIMESCGFDLHQLTIQLTSYYPTKVSQVWCFLGYIFCKNNNWVILKQVISQKLGRISHYSSEIGLFWRLVQDFKLNYNLLIPKLQ